MPFLNIRMEKQARSGSGPAQPAPEGLRDQGPVFPVTLTLTDAAHRALRKKGQTAPNPVSGMASIDTGATASCIDMTAAQEAGLPTRGTSTMSSASHANQRVPVYSGKLMLQQGGVAIDLQNAMGVNLTGSPGVIALIDRDVLQSTVLVYNGPEGSVTVAIG